MKLLTPFQYAKTYGLKRQAVYQKIKRGTIEVVKVTLPDGKVQMYIDVEKYPPEKNFKTKKK